MTARTFTRREMLKLGLVGSAALAIPLEPIARTKRAGHLRESQLPKPFTVPFAVPPVMQPVRREAGRDLYEVTMAPATAEILPGYKTRVFAYNGSVPGPTIQARKGRPAVVRMINELPKDPPLAGARRYTPSTSVHLHGSPNLPQYDGYASDKTFRKQYKDYHFPNSQEARTIWYHDHGAHHTAENVYRGLAGQYLVHDEVEDSLPLPRGRYDVPLILADALFTEERQLLFDSNSESDLFGDVVLVNARPWPVMKVERRKYRFRVLNASVSRSFRLALDSGEELTFVGGDAGLLPAPEHSREFRIAPGERYDVIVDFATHRVGERVVLRNLELDNMVDFDTTEQVMAFDVADEATDTSNNAVPDQLEPHHPVMALKPSQAKKTRQLRFERKHGLWTVNGRTWTDVETSDFNEVVADPGLGDVEIWEYVNNSGGWSHPVHTHLVDVQVLDRNGKPPFVYERGPKDVLYVGKNETVRVLAKFGPHPGKYMVHCHNLVHEDHDMMVQFEVGQNGDHPVYADPPRPLPAPRL